MHSIEDGLSNFLSRGFYQLFHSLPPPTLNEANLNYLVYPGFQFMSN